MTGFED